MSKRRNTNNPISPDWHLPEWMKTLRISQAALSRETGWSVATTNDIYHGRTEYYRTILNEASSALNIQPFELLMHPDDAMSLRRLRESALRIAAEDRSEYKSPEALQSLSATGTDK